MKACDLHRGDHLVGFLVYMDAERVTVDIPVVAKVTRRCCLHHAEPRTHLIYTTGLRGWYPAYAEVPLLDGREADR